ncbi:MAG: VCBS repeat-containing protein [Planctomycetes bacterium]|nr:VCBS repeat-containing protein [Planctomycetota bacterium]
MNRTALLFTNITVSLSGICGAASAQVFPGVQLPTGTSSVPRGLATADLNGDGRFDLVAANSGTSKFAVFLGNGSASGFASPVFFTTGVGPVDVALGDFNADGKIDGATADLTANTISVLIASAPGVFGTPAALVVGSGPNTINIIDINGDGKLDILTNSSNVSTITVFLGNGAGGFGAPIVKSTGQRAERPRAGDLNHDGLLDLVLRDSNTTIGRALGTGGGNFGSISSFVVPDVVSDLAILDLDHDGNADIGGCSAGFPFAFPAFVWSMPGNGAGGLGAVSKVSWTQAATRMVFVDLNNDGNFDVVTTNSQTGLFVVNSISVGIGNNSGQFGAPENYNTGGGPDGIVTLDFNLDGGRDVACASSGGNFIRLFPGDAAGHFYHPNDFVPFGNPLTGAIGDLNRDGKPDLVYSTYTAPTIVAHLGDGAGGLGAAITSTIPYTINAVSLADMNGDFKLDVVAGGYDSGTSTGKLSVAFGAGTGAFGTPSTTIVAAGGVNSQAVFDMNLDGKLDVVTGNYNTTSFASTVTVFLASGTGTFAAPLTYAVAAAPNSLMIGDLNNDGAADVAVAFSQTPAVGVSLGTGAGALGVFSNITIVGSALTAIIDDINHDGAADIVCTSTAGYSFLAGNGAGAFSVTNTSAGFSLNRGRVGDINNDGLSDLVATAGGTSLAVFEGAGTGAFGPSALFAGGTLVDLMDMNADGGLDAVTLVTLFTSGESAVLLNQTPVPPACIQFGSGTPGCYGTLGISANSMPQVNNANFVITSTNCPHSALGLLIVTNQPDFVGSDPFFLGEILHVDLLTSTEIFGFDNYSDAGGTAAVLAAIPNNPALANAQYYAQSNWVEDHNSGQHCSQAQYGLITSRAMLMIIQP